MGYNGSGVYVPPSLPGSWNPAVSGQSATPSDWNTLLADFVSAFDNVICRDGQTTITQNIPFNGKRITGLGDAVATTDAVNAGQVLDNGLTAVDDTGAADAYVIAPAIAITSYQAYQWFQFKAAHANTGASTLNVSSLGVKDIKHADGTALLAGDILAGALCEVMYDGTAFQLLTATGLRGTANTWRAAQTFAATAAMSSAAFNEAHGADIASAGTINLTAATGNVVDVTGTTAITAITLGEGFERTVRFTGALTLTNGASLVLPGAADITTAAGDFAVFRGYAGGVVRCSEYQRLNGQPVAGFVGAAWTPADGSGGGLTFTNLSANYVRIGNMVFACFSLKYPTNTDGNPSLISGLPIAASNANYANVANMVQNDGAAGLTYGLVVKNSQTFGIWSGSAGHFTNVQLSGLTLSGCIIYPAT